MCQDSPLEAYAHEICAAAKIISGYCTLEGSPHPSLDPEAPSITLPHDAPENVQAARERMVGAAAKIQQIATEPCEYLPNLAVQYQRISAIRWLCHFQVLACIPHQGSVPYVDVASICSVPERQLRGIARMAMTSNFLCEPIPGEVAHNAVSRMFLTNPAYLGWVDFMSRFYMPVSSKFVEATEKWGNTEAKNETAANLAMNTELSSFDYITRNRDLGRRFAAYMKGVQASEGTNMRHVVSCYEWERLGNGIVVHIGGSPGTGCITLAEAFPQLRFIVQDTPDTIGNCAGFLKTQPESISNRITTSVHNFFKPQPIRHANIYLLRMVLHNHPDSEAVQILTNLVPALKTNPSARLLIMDTALPDPGTTNAVDESLMRYRDMTMMQVFNTKEREVGEFKDILERAGDNEGNLVLKNIRSAHGSTLSMLEVGYQNHADGLVNGMTNGDYTRS